MRSMMNKLITAPMIDARNVHKRFGALEVLKGVSLTIDKGEVVAVIGPSGSVKAPSYVASIILKRSIVVVSRLRVRPWSLRMRKVFAITPRTLNYAVFVEKWAWFFSTSICSRT